MANKVTIDVEARFVDNVSNSMQAASSSIDKFTKELMKALKNADKLDKENVDPTVDADTDKFIKKIRDAEAKVKKFSRTKTDKVLGATDKASEVIDKVDRKSKKISGKVWTATAKVKDSQAVSALKNIGNASKKIAGKTWTALVKIKDFATSPLRKIKNSLFSIKTLIGTIVAGWAANKLVLNPINVADAYSSAKISFSTLLGKDQGQKMMDDLDAFARVSPFDTTNVISNAQKMLAMGWDAEDIITDMEIIGNAAASTGNLNQGLESIVRALSQIKTKGRLSTEELNQLAEAGIAAKAMLAEQLGYGTGDEGIAKMTEDLEAGAIASNKAIEALLAGMKKFDGMMDSIANETAEGMWSQVKDAFNINIVRRWGLGLQDGAKEGLGTLLGLLDDSEGALQELGDTVYKVGKTISNWFADKLEKAVKKIKEITNSEAFQNASLGGKVKMLWDGVIANPFSEWWNDTVVPWWDKTAVPWLVEKAGKLGTIIGRGLSSGLLALLGVDYVGAVEDGASIAGSFVKGFVDGFDGAAVADAFVDAFGRIWDAMPWWAKALLFGYGASKLGSGIASLMGGFSGLGSALGSATSMTGLLGFGTKAAIGMGAGNLAGGASLGAGALSAMGLASTAGYLYGGATLISGGMDLYNGYKNDDDAAKKSGWWKVGGAGGGALAGMIAGSIIPGVGTLVGAGIGALAGGIFGNWGANREQEKAREKAEALAKAEEKAARMAAQRKKEQKELAKADMAKHFGSIALSMEEVQTAVNNMIGQEAINRAYAASDAISQMDSSLRSFNSMDSSLKKELWLTGLKKQADMTTEDITGLKTSAKNFSEAAKTYLEDAQYASSESITALMGNSEAAKKVMDASTAYYESRNKELTNLSEQLNKALEEALADNVIGVDEQASIDNLRSQIATVMKQIQDDEYTASVNAIKAKFGDSEIDSETFSEMVSQMTETATNMKDSLWDQFGHASLGLTEGSDEWNALKEATIAEIAGVWESAGSLGLDKLQDRWSEELGILGSDLATTLETETAQDILSAAGSISEDTRASISEWLEMLKPTTEQIQEIVDAYEDLGKEPPEALKNYLSTVDFYDALAKGLHSVRGYLSNYYQENPIEMDIDAIAGSIDWTLDDEQWKSLEGKLKVEANGYVDINWTYDKFDDEWISPSLQYSFTTDALVNAGWTFNKFDGTWMSPDKHYSFKTDVAVEPTYSTAAFAGTMATFGIHSRYPFSPIVDITPTYNVPAPRLPLGPYATGNSARGNIWYPSGVNAPGYADGGMVRGGARLITVAEEGTPEMIIPLGSQRRERALDLFQKTGELLDVPGFARGGRTTGGSDEGIGFRQYEATGVAGGQVVQIEVGGITVEINVEAKDGENITEVIKKQAKEIADEVAGILADALSGQFENTPVRGGVA